MHQCLPQLQLFEIPFLIRGCFYRNDEILMRNIYKSLQYLTIRHWTFGLCAISEREREVWINLISNYKKITREEFHWQSACQWTEVTPSSVSNREPWKDQTENMLFFVSSQFNIVKVSGGNTKDFLFTLRYWLRYWYY